MASIWDNFDIEKISNARFKQDYISPVTEGDQLIVGIEEEYTSTEIEYWKNVVVCYVLGAHPPFSVLNGYIQRQWGKLGISKIAMLKNGIVLVRFDSVEGKNEVLQGGVYHFDNKPLIVKAWNPDMEKLGTLTWSSQERNYTQYPYGSNCQDWIFKYWNAKGLSKIGSLVGKPLMVDKNTEKKLGLNFAKLLVEVKIGSKLPDVIYFKNERGNIIEQQVTYDWKPYVCTICQNYGHSAEECRRNKAKIPQEKPTPVIPEEKSNEEVVTEQLDGRDKRKEQPDGRDKGGKC
ncbi:uncharacterized protein LOC132607872 [Lycium barbarum]|uniref:uncharacterized protein LOC132607872 n=1 Tax=Lycium barbarum TaxID=112863 RepID=UPI00293E8874|nr:uncharacterized protein LOC132607872 [Lycium barbarum]